MLYAFNNSADVNTANLTINNNQLAFNATDKISIIKLSNSSTTSIPYGLYRLTPKSALHSSLDATGKHNHPVLIRSQYWSDLNQQWLIKPEDNGFYRLINRGNGQVLGVDACNANNRGVVRLQDWSDFDCQRWKFDLLPSSYYRVTPMHAQDQCLHVHQCSLNDVTKVQ